MRIYDLNGMKRQTEHQPFNHRGRKKTRKSCALFAGVLFVGGSLILTGVLVLSLYILRFWSQGLSGWSLIWRMPAPFVVFLSFTTAGARLTKKRAVVSCASE